MKEPQINYVLSERELDLFVERVILTYGQEKKVSGPGVKLLREMQRYAHESLAQFRWKQI